MKPGIVSLEMSPFFFVLNDIMLITKKIQVKLTHLNVICSCIKFNFFQPIKICKKYNMALGLKCVEIPALNDCHPFLVCVGPLGLPETPRICQWGSPRPKHLRTTWREEIKPFILVVHTPLYTYALDFYSELLVRVELLDSSVVGCCSHIETVA